MAIDAPTKNLDPSEDPVLLRRVAAELEELRQVSSINSTPGMPPACRNLMMRLPGNLKCVDCGAPNPDWASVSFGTLLCVCCSGRHRSYGVATSRVRSVSMDAWTYSHVLQVLEGGNGQLQTFFGRHRLGPLHQQRYLTRAAAFYRTHLAQHADSVATHGPYRGRNASRGGQSQRRRRQSVPKKQSNEGGKLVKDDANNGSCSSESTRPSSEGFRRRAVAVQ